MVGNREFKPLGDASAFMLEAGKRDRLLALQYECTLSWTNKTGDPVSCTTGYTYDDHVIWMCAEEHRVRVKAFRRDPRAAVTVSSLGTRMGVAKTVSFKGRIEVISGDRELGLWVMRAINTKIFPQDAEAVEQHSLAGDSPSRVVLKFTPETITNAFDGDKTVVKIRD